jgi:two-component system sensor histidine kinase MprB
VEDEVTAFRLDSVVEDAVQRARFHAPQVEFDVRSSPSVVKGSPWRVERAVRNLLDNARKWSPPGAIVEVVVGDARVTVRDRGPGVSDDDAPRIFDRFYRSPAARGVPGSGLGLAIVRQVADDHGGSVRVEKAEGGGSRFILDLDFNSGDRHMRRRPTTPSASN